MAKVVLCLRESFQRSHRLRYKLFPCTCFGHVPPLSRSGSIPSLPSFFMSLSHAAAADDFHQCAKAANTFCAIFAEKPAAGRPTSPTSLPNRAWHGTACRVSFPGFSVLSFYGNSREIGSPVPREYQPEIPEIGFFFTNSPFFHTF
jgi:hypothetical protein